MRQYGFMLMQTPHETTLTANQPASCGFWRRLRMAMGPGFLVAVGYMDPGNWATDLAGGSAYGYQLLSVVLLSSLAAIFLQAMAARLGIGSGRDLAQACSQYFPAPVGIALWALAEIAICACDMAEIIGSAIALNLLFGLPLALGALLTAGDVLLLLGLQRLRRGKLEMVVASLLGVIAVCFLYDLWLARPDPAEVLAGFIPHADILRNSGILYIAIGIVGATIMPHNLYLHSNIVRTDEPDTPLATRQQTLRFATLDVGLSLIFALFVNAAILVLAASTFHHAGKFDVAELPDAFNLLTPLLGTELAAIAFAVALLASGLNATITATMAGQIVMEGFMKWQMKPWQRRLFTRSIAMVPAVVAAMVYGPDSMGSLLVASQVILCLQLPFAVVPLLMFTGNRRVAGGLAASRTMQAIGWTIATVLIGADMWLLVSFF